MNFLRTLLGKSPTAEDVAVPAINSYDKTITAAIEALCLDVQLGMLELMLAELQDQGKMPSAVSNPSSRPLFSGPHIAETLDRFRADVLPFISNNPSTLNGDAEWSALSLLHAKLSSALSKQVSWRFSERALPFSDRLLKELVTYYGPRSMAKPNQEHVKAIALKEYVDSSRTPEAEQASAFAPHARMLRSYGLEDENGSRSLDFRGLTGHDADLLSLARATALYYAGMAYIMSRRILREISSVYREGVLSASNDGKMDAGAFARMKHKTLKRWTAEDQAGEKRDTGFLMSLFNRALAADRHVRENLERDVMSYL